MKRMLLAFLLIFGFILNWSIVFAGDLDAPAPPTSADSAMYTLADIYNRLNDGTAGAKRTGAFTEPTSGPGSTGHTLDEVMGKAPSVDDANGAGVAEVLENKTFWGLTSGAWGTKTGTMTNNGAGVFECSPSSSKYCRAIVSAADPMNWHIEFATCYPDGTLSNWENLITTIDVDASCNDCINLFLASDLDGGFRSCLSCMTNTIKIMRMSAHDLVQPPEDRITCHPLSFPIIIR